MFWGSFTAVFILDLEGVGDEEVIQFHHALSGLSMESAAPGTSV